MLLARRMHLQHVNYNANHETMLELRGILPMLAALPIGSAVRYNFTPLGRAAAAHPWVA